MTVKSAANGKFLVTPQLEKGKVCLSRGDDQLLHFQWVDRQTGASPEDFIIFPDDAHFEKVDTGRPDDRVYILQYKNSSRRFFFWMQVLPRPSCPLGLDVARGGAGCLMDMCLRVLCGAEQGRVTGRRAGEEGE